MKQLLPSILAGTALGLATLSAPAQLSITSSNLSYSQDFNTLTRSTTAENWTDNANTASVNDSPQLIGLVGWYVASYTNATFQSTTYTPLIRAGTGSSTTGSFYSFGSSSDPDRALGTLPTDGITAGGSGSLRIAARFVNDTGETLNGFTFSYDGEQWRKAQISTTGGVNNQYVVSYAIFDAGSGTLDNGLYSSSIAGATFNTPVDGGDNVGAALNGNDPANRVAGLGATITNIEIAPGQEVWLRWFDANSSSADHGIAIDNFSIAFAVPEPSAAVLLGFGFMLLINRARRVC